MTCWVALQSASLRVDPVCCNFRCEIHFPVPILVVYQTDWHTNNKYCHGTSYLNISAEEMGNTIINGKGFRVVLRDFLGGPVSSKSVAGVIFVSRQNIHFQRQYIQCML